MNRELRYRYHSQSVAAWIEKSMATLTKSKLTDRFEKSLEVLLKKAQISVSELTLAAVLDRVLFNSSEQYPILSAIKLNGARLNFSAAKKGFERLSDAQIKEAFHYLITEFLSVIGNLTGEQLTPLLYRELTASHSQGPAFKKSNEDER